VTGSLSVGFVLGVTPGKWERVWAERMPRATLQLLSLEQPEAMQSLRDGSLDLAFVRLPHGAEPDDDIAAIPLYDELPVVAIARDHELSLLDRIAPDDLDGVALADGEWRDDIELVATGSFAAVVPQSVARALSRRDVVVRPAEGWPVTRVGLVWYPERATELTEEFIGVVRGRTANSSRGTRTAAPEPRSSRATPPRRGARGRGDGRPRRR
jgi:DNA-binding transcriptional LysR family regulator